MGMPGYGFGFGMQNMNGAVPGRDGKMKEAGGFGAELKDDYRRFYGVGFGMAGRGMSIAREDNYCEIDPEVVDKFGIPVLRFHYKWSNEEVMQAKHMQDTFQSVMHEMGAIYGPPQGPETNYGLEAPAKSYTRLVRYAWATTQKNLRLINIARRMIAITFLWLMHRHLCNRAIKMRRGQF